MAWLARTATALNWPHLAVGWLCLTRPLSGDAAVVAEGRPEGEPKRR